MEDKEFEKNKEKVTSVEAWNLCVHKVKVMHRCQELCKQWDAFIHPESSSKEDSQILNRVSKNLDQVIEEGYSPENCMKLLTLTTVEELATILSLHGELSNRQKLLIMQISIGLLKDGLED